MTCDFLLNSSRILRISRNVEVKLAYAKHFPFHNLNYDVNIFMWPVNIDKLLLINKYISSYFHQFHLLAVISLTIFLVIQSRYRYLYLLPKDD